MKNKSHQSALGLSLPFQLALMTVVIAGVLIVAPGRATASTTVSNGKIAFDNSDPVWTVNSDGTGQTTLTNAGLSPSYSPDGSKIAFVSDRDGNSEIYSMNADGTSQTNLTNDPSSDAGPDWSPEGSKIAFSSNRSDGFSYDIYSMNTDGTNQVNLTNTPGNGEYAPVWSPSGTQIVYSSNGFVWLMNGDGTGQISVGVIGRPYDWSPDGTTILFSPGSPLYSINPDGTGQMQLTNGAGIEGASYSPDGTKIAFSEGVTLKIMNADGTNQVQVLNESGDPIPASIISWQPIITVIPDPVAPAGSAAAISPRLDALSSAPELPAAGGGTLPMLATTGALAGGYYAHRRRRRRIVQY